MWEVMTVGEANGCVTVKMTLVYVTGLTRHSPTYVKSRH